MAIILTGVLLAIWLVVILYKYTRKRFLKHLVYQELKKEFNEELENRVKQHVVFSTDPELANLILESQKTKDGEDLFFAELDKIREIKREKMLRERFGRQR